MPDKLSIRIGLVGHSCPMRSSLRALGLALLGSSPRRAVVTASSGTGGNGGSGGSRRVSPATGRDRRNDGRRGQQRRRPPGTGGRGGAAGSRRRLGGQRAAAAARHGQRGGHGRRDRRRRRGRSGRRDRRGRSAERRRPRRHDGGTAGAGGSGGAAGGSAGAGGRGGTAGGGGPQARAGAAGTQAAPRRTAEAAARRAAPDTRSRSSANGTGVRHPTPPTRTSRSTLGSDLPIGNTQRTIEFWAYIKTTDWVGEQNQVYYYGTSGTAASFGLDFGTNPVMGMSDNHATLDPFTGGGFSDDSTNDLGINSSTDQWVHVAMVWNGTNLITYVNGLPKITTSGQRRRHDARDRVLGADPRLQPDQQQLLQRPVRRAADLEGRAHGDGDPRQLQQARRRPTAPTWSATGSSTRRPAPPPPTPSPTAGHTAHNGTLKAMTTAQNPTFVMPTAPLPLVCP